jgi:hypothetical protein
MPVWHDPGTSAAHIARMKISISPTVIVVQLRTLRATDVLTPAPPRSRPRSGRLPRPGPAPRLGVRLVLLQVLRRSSASTWASFAVGAASAAEREGHPVRRRRAASFKIRSANARDADRSGVEQPGGTCARCSTAPARQPSRLGASNHEARWMNVRCHHEAAPLRLVALVVLPFARQEVEERPVPAKLVRLHAVAADPADQEAAHRQRVARTASASGPARLAPDSGLPGSRSRSPDGFEVWR